MKIGIALRKIEAWFRTNNSAVIDRVELARLVLQAGWSGEDAVIAVAIVGGESGYRIEAMNVDKRHGKEDYGLFQLNQDHKPTERDKWVPEDNVRFAYALWAKQKKWIEHLRKQKAAGLLKAGGPDPDTMDPFNRWMAYRDRHANDRRAASWVEFMIQARAAINAAQAER